jgi:hypothetical protein
MTSLLEVPLQVPVCEDWELCLGVRTGSFEPSLNWLLTLAMVSVLARCLGVILYNRTTEWAEGRLSHYCFMTRCWRSHTSSVWPATDQAYKEGRNSSPKSVRRKRHLVSYSWYFTLERAGHEWRRINLGDWREEGGSSVKELSLRSLHAASPSPGLFQSHLQLLNSSFLNGPASSVPRTSPELGSQRTRLGTDREQSTINSQEERWLTSWGEAEPTWATTLALG